MGNIRNNKKLKKYRLELRRNETNPEKKLWSYLRNENFYNYKFYRQYSIGKYILDFYCHSLKLGIEVDGDSHYTIEGIENDSRRTKDLENYDVKILRFSNLEIQREIFAVLEVIRVEIFGD